ncbi:hypothetical protein LCGC14_1591350, partial [marine sediment metagenome]
LEQKLEAHRLANLAGMSRKAYEKLAVETTGKKSMTQMSDDEATRFILAIGKKDIELPFKDVSTQIASKQARSLSHELAESLGGRPSRLGVVTKETTRKSIIAQMSEMKESYLARTEFIENIMLRADNLKEGKLFQTFIRSADDATDKMMLAQLGRETAVMTEIKKWGLNIGHLLTTVTEISPGIRLTSLERMGLYLHSKNHSNWTHVVRGNFRGLVAQSGYKKTNDLLKGVVDGLSDREKALAEWMFRDVQKNTKSVAEAYKSVTGKKMKEVENYWRITLKEFDDIEIDPMVRILQREYTKRFPSARIKKSFTLPRTAKAQQPIELDAMDVFLRYNNEVEHYKAMYPLIRDLQRIYFNPRFRSAFTEKMGQARYKVVGNWVEDIAASDPLFLINAREKVLKTLRSNATTGILGLGIPIAFKQLPSFLLGATEVGTTRALGSLLKTISPAGYAETKDLIRRVSPQMFNRVMIREIAEIKASNTLVNRLTGKRNWREWAMIFTLTTDRLATTSIWRAAFDKSLAQGMTEKVAARQALQITRRTQPFFSIKDVPDFWRSGEGFRMLTMFQNQLSRNFNYVRTHILASAKAGKISKAEALRRFVEGILIPGMFIGMISSGRMPKDPADFARNSIRPLVAMFPIFGPMASSAMGGFYDTTDPATFQILSEMSRAVYYANQNEWGKFLGQLPQIAGYAKGIPVNAPQRFIEGMIRMAQGKSDDWLELIWGEYVRKEARKQQEGRRGRGIRR